MFRYELRTLLIILALGPPALAFAWLTWPLVPLLAPFFALLIAPMCFGVHRAELLRERRERRRRRS